jgi:hypothetical protein
VLRLFDAGRTVAQIARRLRISKQAVSVHLRDSGRDPAAAKGRAGRAKNKRFAALWHAAPDLGAAAAALGLTEARAGKRATELRAAGLRLKYMPRRPGLSEPRPKAAPVAARVLELHNRGVSRADILRRTGANTDYVTQLLRGSYRPRCMK